MDFRRYAPCFCLHASVSVIGQAFALKFWQRFLTASGFFKNVTTLQHSEKGKGVQGNLESKLVYFTLLYFTLLYLVG
jgi:hypothetical protein